MLPRLQGGFLFLLRAERVPGGYEKAAPKAAPRSFEEYGLILRKIALFTSGIIGFIIYGLFA